jgi:hypothetical protein
MLFSLADFDVLDDVAPFVAAGEPCWPDGYKKSYKNRV